MRTLRNLAPLALCALAAAAHAGRPFSSAWGTGAGVAAFDRLHNLNTQGPDSLSAGGAGIGEAQVQMDMSTLYHDGGGSAKAYASANTGRMGAATDVEKFVPENGVALRSAARAMLWDTVTFDVDRITQPIYVKLALDGGTSGGGLQDSYGSYADFHLYLYDLDNNRALIDYDSGQVTSDFAYGGSVLADATAIGYGKRHFQIGYVLDTDSIVDGSTLGVADTEANFYHTLKFGWDLPTGLTYTSASGVFAPPPTQAVPEPATLATLAVGALGLTRRRRR